MTNTILEKIKSKHAKIYPRENLYLGYYTNTITKDNVTSNYEHYDFFIGDSNNLQFCTKFKRITGNYKTNDFDTQIMKEYTLKTYQEMGIKPDYSTYFLYDSEYNASYHIYNTIFIKELCINYCGDNFSLNRLQNYVQKKNKFNQSNAQKSAIASTKNQENIDEIFSHK